MIFLNKYISFFNIIIFNYFVYFGYRYPVIFAHMMPFLYLYTNIYLFYYTYISYEIEYILNLKIEEEELREEYTTENEDSDLEKSDQSDYISDNEKTKIE